MLPARIAGLRLLCCGCTDMGNALIAVPIAMSAVAVKLLLVLQSRLRLLLL